MKMFKLIILFVVTFLALSDESFAWTISDNSEGTGTNSFFSTYYSDDYHNSGNFSVKFFIGQGDESVGIYSYRLGGELAEGDELWVRVYIYAPAGFDWTATPITKLLRIVVANPDGTGNGYHSILATRPGNYGCAGENIYGYVVTGSEMNSSQTPPPICQNMSAAGDEKFLTPGQWHTIELYLKISSVDGVMRAWVNGELVAEYHYPTILAGGKIPIARTSNWMDHHLLGWWNGGATQDQFLYFDDLIITNETPGSVDAHGNQMIGSTVSASSRRLFRNVRIGEPES